MRAPAISPASRLGRLALSSVALMLATTLAGASAVADEPADHAADGAAASELDAAGADGAVSAGDLAGEGADGAPDDAHDAYQGALLAGQLSMELPLEAVADSEDTDGTGEAEAPATLAGYLAAGELRVSADVALAADGEDVEPVVGSFTVDGMTYAVTGEGEAALVAVSPRTLAGSLVEGSAGDLAGAPSGEGIGSGVPPRSEAEQVPSGATSPSPSPEGTSSDGAEREASASCEAAGEPSALAIPASVEHDGVAYAVTSVGPRALAGCDADVVIIPVTVELVDESAFRGSAVASVEVAEGNPHVSSYDGMLFDVEQIRLLLIPEGKQGAARIPKTAEVVDLSSFSHSAGVDSIDVEAGSAAFSSRNGCLYDASGETLLRVPAGATEVEIADGCVTVAAGSMEGCESLARLWVPSSVDVVDLGAFGSTATASAAAQVPVNEVNAIAVAVGLPSMTVVLSEGAGKGPWRALGLTRFADSSQVGLGHAAGADAANVVAVNYHANSDHLARSWDYGANVAFHGMTRYLFGSMKEADIQVGGNGSLWKLSDGGPDPLHPDRAKEGVWGVVIMPDDTQVLPIGLAGSEDGAPNPRLVSGYTLPNGSYELYCVFEECEYEFHIWYRGNSSGGGDLGKKKLRLGRPVPKVTGDHEVAKGWHFAGMYAWTGDGDDPVMYTDRNGEPVKRNNIPDGYVIVAMHEPNHYTVNFYDPAGTTLLATRTMEYSGSTLQPPDEVYDELYAPTVDQESTYKANNYYDLMGWSKVQNGVTADYTFGQEDPDVTDVEDETVNLYLARQSKEAWFNPNGGKVHHHVEGSNHAESEDYGTKSTYRIVWDGNTDTQSRVYGSTNHVHFSNGDKANCLDLNRTGYTFAGWKVYDRDKKEVTDWRDRPIVRGATYVAQWTPNSYGVAYWSKDGKTKLHLRGLVYDSELQGDTNDWKGQLLPLTGTFKGVPYDFRSYVTQGHTAVGWSKDKGDTVADYDFGATKPNLTSVKLNSETGEGIVDLYLAEVEDVATFDPGGGILYVHGEGVGHGEQGEGKALKHTEATKVRWVGSKATRVYGAGENAIFYNVHFIDLGSEELRCIDAVKPGYTLTGWKVTGSDGKAISDWAEKPIVRGATYVAQWNPVTYGVNYWNKDGSFKLHLRGVLYDSEETGDENAWRGQLLPLSGTVDGRPYDFSSHVTRGYTAVGWSKDKGDTVADYDFGATKPNLATRPHTEDAGQVHLYLAEEPHPYNVVFDPGEGAWEDSAEGEGLALLFDQDVALAAAPKRAGYAFAGWEAMGPDGQAYVLEAGSTLAAGKLKAAEGGAAAVPLSYGDPDAEGNPPTVTLAARWVADLRVDVPVSVSLDLTVDWEQGRVAVAGPDGAPYATGEFRSWSSGGIRVAALGQEASTAGGHRHSALGFFASGDEAKAGNLAKARLTLSADDDGAGSLSFPLSELYALQAGSHPGAMANPQDLSPLGLVVPAASSAADPGTLCVRYGMDCEGLPLEDVAIDERPRPILKLVYKVELVNP